MSNKRLIYYYLGISFVLSWTLFLLPLAFKSDPFAYQRMTRPFWAAAMWGPALAAIIVTLFIAREPFGSLRLNRLGSFRYYLAAWFIPPLLVAAAIGLSILFGTAQFDSNLTSVQALADQSARAGVKLSPTVLILIQIAQGLVLGPVINVLFTMGEELGWRGFLLPRMLPMGQWKALIWSGVIWGVWHAPVILQGYNYPQHPVLGVLLMIVFCILLSIIIGWMYLRTRSPWAAAIAHGSINAWAGLPLLFLVPGFDTAIGGMVLSVTGFVVLAAFIGLLAFTKGLPVEDEPVTPTQPAEHGGV